MALMTIGAAQAQNGELNSDVMNVFNFSRLGLNGSASYVGRAGAIGALGADFTAASYNPAGLGMFYSSELSITPTIDYSMTNSHYMGINTDDSRTTFTLGSVEALFAIPTNNLEENTWRAMQFGIGMNRLKSFNNRSYVSGGVTPFSLLDVWCDNANEYGLDEFGSQLAYNLYLIDTLPGGTRFFNNFSGSTNQLRQVRHNVVSGGINEMVISFSGNYSDKFYVGATIGIPFLSYYRSSAYRETAENTGQKYDFTENYDVNATGINLKVGAIYRPIEMLRFGLALHTPTYYDVKDVYTTRMETGGQFCYSRESEGSFSFRTPMKLIASVGAAFGNLGSSMAASVDFDYEFTNYHGMRFSALGDNMTDLYYEAWRNDMNNLVKETYQAEHTLRFGGSLNIRHWVLRAGVAYFSNPYKEYEEYEHKNVEAMSVACGFGYRTSHFFVDFAYAHTVMQDTDYFNTYSMNPITSNFYSNLFMSTIGVKF